MMRLVLKFLDSIKYLRLWDILGALLFVLILPFALIFKLYLKLCNKQLWLVSEGKNSAHDNGYIFYKYLKNSHPEINSYYAISKDCKEYSKVAALGNIVNFGSLKHWVYYISARKNISNHKSANPSPAVFYLLHSYQILNGHRIYLKHGIVKDNTRHLHYQETKFELFICGAMKEYQYVMTHFGYPEGNVCLTGLPRFDELWNKQARNNQVVIMPTWRYWLGREKNILSKNEYFANTEYFQKYQSLLDNKKLISYVENNGINVYFYLHSNMQKFIGAFKSESKNIKIVSQNDYDIQNILIDSAVMITDYSSVAFDFAYMQKPVIYYQFDLNRYREGQYEEGYFNYQTMGFGPVFKQENELVEAILETASLSNRINDKYSNRRLRFFETRDELNSERVFNRVLEYNNSSSLRIFRVAQDSISSVCSKVFIAAKKYMGRI